MLSSKNPSNFFKTAKSKLHIGNNKEVVHTPLVNTSSRSVLLDLLNQVYCIEYTGSSEIVYDDTLFKLHDGLKPLFDSFEKNYVQLLKKRDVLTKFRQDYSESIKKTEIQNPFLSETKLQEIINTFHESLFEIFKKFESIIEEILKIKLLLIVTNSQNGLYNQLTNLLKIYTEKLNIIKAYLVDIGHYFTGLSDKINRKRDKKLKIFKSPETFEFLELSELIKSKKNPKYNNSFLNKLQNIEENLNDFSEDINNFKLEIDCFSNANFIIKATDAYYLFKLGEKIKIEEILTQIKANIEKKDLAQKDKKSKRVSANKNYEEKTANLSSILNRYENIKNKILSKTQSAISLPELNVSIKEYINEKQYLKDFDCTEQSMNDEEKSVCEKLEKDIQILLESKNILLKSKDIIGNLSHVILSFINDKLLKIKDSITEYKKVRNREYHTIDLEFDKAIENIDDELYKKFPSNFSGKLIIPSSNTEEDDGILYVNFSPKANRSLIEVNVLNYSRNTYSGISAINIVIDIINKSLLSKPSDKVVDIKLSDEAIDKQNSPSVSLNKIS